MLGTLFLFSDVTRERRLGRSTETFACQESQTLMQQYFDADGAFLAPVAGTASLYD